MIYTLMQRWQEPSEGSAVHTLDLTDDEAGKVREAIAWLQQHGGDNIGDTLCEFVLQAEPKLSGEADYTGLDATMAMLALESRYEEDRTFYHDTERHPLLEAACQSPGHWI